MAQLQDETDEMALDRTNESLDAWWSMGERVPFSPVSEEDETQSPPPQDLPRDLRFACGLRNEGATEIERFQHDEDGTVASLVTTAVDPIEDFELEDLPGVPSAIEDVVPIQPLNETGYVYNDQSDIVPFEPLKEGHDIPLQHSATGRMLDSIFDLIPLDPMASPYSWMIEYPGKIPETIQPPTKEKWFNVDGETDVEWAIKSFVAGPKEYFLIATSVKALVHLRYKKIITEQAYASLLFRTTDRDPRLWFPIRKAFVSDKFAFVTLRGEAINQAIAPLYDSVKHIQTMEFMKGLTRLIEALLIHSHGSGYLIDKESGKPVAQELRYQHDLDISDDFMRRLSCSWPFEDITPDEADVYGVGEPLAFEEVFGNAEYLARKKAVLEMKESARQGDKSRERWAFPVEEAKKFLNKVFDVMES